jgi:pimeloyl-ACP methyl ester carboxylesterase
MAADGPVSVAPVDRSRYGPAPVLSRSRRPPAVLPALALTVAVAALMALAPAARAQSRALRACPGQGRFGCGTLTVPLDYSGRVPGTVALHFAAQRSFPHTGKILIALTGGPGQPGIDFATPSSLSLEPALRQYRLVVLDQRGTGESGVLRCPQVQALRTLDPFLPQTVAGCAAQVGPRRVFYSSADTVLDLESLRRRLGATKVALMGISYGTHVALQYARAFPQNVDRLVLDSIVGPDGPDAFLLDTYRNLPRVLREQCANNRCAGATSDPVADVAALVSRINTGGPLRGTFFDDHGRRRPTSYHTPDELAFLLIQGDLSPLLQAALPGAIGAARRGDTAELMRLRRIAQGSRTPTADLSFGLNVTTGCLDAPLPYPLATTPISARPAIAQAALAAIPPAQYAPFDGQTVLRTSYVDDCLFWPNDAARPQFRGPLPDVPALLLGGRLDMRTPIENAFATHALLPHSTVVALPGNGHDATDSDQTGCIARATSRFFHGRTVGNPCRGRNNGFRPLPSPPRSLSDFRSAPGVGGTRGRALFAVLDTVQDAIVTASQLQDAQLPLRGGGLRGGDFRILEGGTAVRLSRYAFVPGLRVGGTLRAGATDISGRLTVQGPRGTSGFVRLTRTGATGRLGGRPFTFRAPRATTGGAAAVDTRRAGAAPGPDLLARLLHPRARRIVP